MIKREKTVHRSFFLDFFKILYYLYFKIVDKLYNLCYMVIKMKKILGKVIPLALILTLGIPFSAKAITQPPLIQQQICLVEQKTALVVSKEKPKPKTETTKQSNTSSSSKSKKQTPTQTSVSDRELLYHLVQHEIGGGSLEHKRIIAQVIINRVNSPKFPNTIYGVIYAPGQFSGSSEIMSMHPDAETIQAVDEVLDGKCQDNSQGALYFYNPKYVGGSTKSWFESLDFLFEMEGHRFFK